MTASEVRTPGGNRASADNQSTDAVIVHQPGRDCNTTDLQAKVRATLAAQLAHAGGFVLLDLADGSYLVTRWNASRRCPDLRAVAQFARHVGACQ